MLAYFGACPDTSALTWTVAHGDLHWGNVTAPELNLFDWDLWGAAPAGYDAATLLVTALLQPAVAERVAHEFADVLTTHTGIVSQLLAGARLLHHVEKGEHFDLAPQVHAHARILLSGL